MNNIRPILRRLARGWAFRRTLATDGLNVPLFVAPEAQLKYFKPGVQIEDAELIRIAKLHVRADSVVWDVGANVGVFTFASALLATKGCVVAIEADIWLASLLGKTRQMPAYQNRRIQIIPAAVAEKCGVANFLISRAGRASNTLERAGGRTQFSSALLTTQVPVLTLDVILESQPAPDFVKMDIEAAELLALQGATRLIQEVRPVFYIETGDDTSMAVFQLFQKAGYKAIHPETRAEIAACAPNTYFAPAENSSALNRLMIH